VIRFTRKKVVFLDSLKRLEILYIAHPRGITVHREPGNRSDGSKAMLSSYVARCDQGRWLGSLHRRILISGGFCTGFRKVFHIRFDCRFEIGAQVGETRSAECPSVMVRTFKQPTLILLVFVNRVDPFIGFLKSSDNFGPCSFRILFVICPARLWLLACAVLHASRVQ
jgi:hypothetical protein